MEDDHSETQPFKPSPEKNVPTSADSDRIPEKTITTKQLIAGLAGNVLEWYDFTVFGYLTDPIAENFFPSNESNFARVLSTYGIFCVAFMARPLGGMLFGWIGDKHGRKTGINLSILLMLFATTAMGLLPTYGRIGITSCLLLLILRMFQGISCGGQFVGSTIYFFESAAEDRRGFYTSLVQVFGGVGSVLGSVVVSITMNSMSERSMNSYGWRIPFLISILIGIVGWLASKDLPHSHDYSIAMARNELHDNPVSYVWKHHKKDIIGIALIIATTACGFYVEFIWLPNYALRMDPPFKQALTMNSVLLAFVGLALIVGGVLSDKHGWRGLLRYPGIIQIALALPLFWCFGAFPGQWWPMALIQILLGTTLCLQVAALQMFLGGAIDSVGVRYSIGGIGYNIGLAFFGGTAPLVSESLAHFGTLYVGLYVLLCTLLSLVVAEGWYTPSTDSNHKYSDLDKEKSVTQTEDNDDVQL